MNGYLRGVCEQGVAFLQYLDTCAAWDAAQERAHATDQSRGTEDFRTAMALMISLFHSRGEGLLALTIFF